MANTDWNCDKISSPTEVTFRYVDTFKWHNLELLDDNVSDNTFVTRHQNFFHKWRLSIYRSISVDNDAKPVGVGIGLADFIINKIQMKVIIFCEPQRSGDTATKRTGKPEIYHNLEAHERLSAELFPSLQSLKDEGFVADDGIVRAGVSLRLQTSSFDPLRYVPQPVQDPSDNLAQNLFKNCSTGLRKISDFLIIAGEEPEEKEFPVSMIALETSPYFAKMFEDEKWKENKDRTLRIPTYTPAAVEEALRFIYLKEFYEDLTRFLPSPLADIWELDHLKIAIHRDMIKKLVRNRQSVDLALQYFKLSYVYEFQVLQRVAICRLWGKTKERWEELSKEQQSDITDVCGTMFEVTKSCE